MAVGNDLNALRDMPAAAFAAESIRNPVNAWPGASSEIYLRSIIIENGVHFQLGQDAGIASPIWFRKCDWKHEAGHFTPWEVLQAELPQGSGTLAGYATSADGTARLAHPQWQKVPFIAASGDICALSGEDIEILQPGIAYIQVRGEVFHSWGRHIIFGYSWNGGAPMEAGRVKVESNTPIYVFLEFPHRTFTAGDLLSFYISSDFEWADFSWWNAQALFLIPPSQAQSGKVIKP